MTTTSSSHHHLTNKHPNHSNTSQLLATLPETPATPPRSPPPLKESVPPRSAEAPSPSPAHSPSPPPPAPAPPPSRGSPAPALPRGDPPPRAVTHSRLPRSGNIRGSPDDPPSSDFGPISVPRSTRFPRESTHRPPDCRPKRRPSRWSPASSRSLAEIPGIAAETRSWREPRMNRGNGTHRIGRNGRFHPQARSQIVVFHQHFLRLGETGKLTSKSVDLWRNTSTSLNKSVYSRDFWIPSFATAS